MQMKKKYYNFKLSQHCVFMIKPFMYSYVCRDKPVVVCALWVYKQKLKSFFFYDPCMTRKLKKNEMLLVTVHCANMVDVFK